MHFGKNSIAQLIDLEKHNWLVNCASKEYFSAVESHIDADKVITPIFKQKKGDIYKVVSFSAKKHVGLLLDISLKIELQRYINA